RIQHSRRLTTSIHLCHCPSTLAPLCCLLIRPPPTPTLFPYTTLFRSAIQNFGSSAASAIARPSFVAYVWYGAMPPVSASAPPSGDRKSTRLNSSHLGISYAVFCLKKKKIKNAHVLRARTSAQSHYAAT